MHTRARAPNPKISTTCRAIDRACMTVRKVFGLENQPASLCAAAEIKVVRLANRALEAERMVVELRKELLSTRAEIGETDELEKALDEMTDKYVSARRQLTAVDNKLKWLEKVTKEKLAPDNRPPVRMIKEGDVSPPPRPQVAPVRVVKDSRGKPEPPPPTPIPSDGQTRHDSNTSSLKKEKPAKEKKPSCSQISDAVSALADKLRSNNPWIKKVTIEEKPPCSYVAELCEHCHKKKCDTESLKDKLRGKGLSFWGMP